MDDEYISCPACDGTGWISDCPDDLCQGEDGCIHGDNIMCDECDGNGVVPNWTYYDVAEDMAGEE